MASWLPSTTCTCPPLACASPCRRISRSMTLRESAPRSSRSPRLTRCVCPAAQWSCASTIPVSRSKCEQFGVGTVHVRESDHAIDSVPLHRRGLRPRLPRHRRRRRPATTRQAGIRVADGVHATSVQFSGARRGRQGDLAAIDALEQSRQQPVHRANLRLAQAHLQVCCLHGGRRGLADRFSPFATGT